MSFNKSITKRAFTLAEMLITMTIMCVIMTLSVSVINTGYTKKETVIRLQKAYEDINKAVSNGIIENDSVEYWDFDMDSNQFLETYLSTLSFDKEIELHAAYNRDSSIDIWVDLNGTKKRPNRFGLDIFPISVVSDGTVLLPTWIEDEGVDKTVKTRAELLTGCQTNRYWCGALIQRDGWKIKDDYPLKF